MSISGGDGDADDHLSQHVHLLVPHSCHLVNKFKNTHVVDEVVESVGGVWYEAGSCGLGCAAGCTAWDWQVEKESRLVGS